MRKIILGSITVIFAGAGLILSQTDGLPTIKDPVKSAPPAEKTRASAPAPAAVVPVEAGPGCCTAGGCAPQVLDDGGYGHGGGFYASADYLLWWIKDSRIPPLVTSGSALDFPPGALGQPGTKVLIGGEIDHEELSGGRFTAGYWCGDCQDLGFEGRFFFLGSRSTRLSASSPPNEVLAQPFFDLNTGQENTEIAAFPGLSTATVSVTDRTQFLGAEANVLWQLCCSEPPCTSCCSGCEGGCCNRGNSCYYNTHLIGGFRYLHLKEDLGINEDIHVNTDLSAFPSFQQFAGDHITVTDQFGTKNDFYGGQVGVDTVFGRGPVWVEFRGTVALGNTHETLNINGGQQIVTPGGSVSNFQGGLFALSSNSGHFDHDNFAVVPELNVNVGYQFSKHVGVEVGYTFLYWSRVLRPGDQIDRELDETRIPNFGSTATPLAVARPAVPFNVTDFWAQGVNVGLTFRW